MQYRKTPVLESLFRPATLLKRDSNNVFLWLLWNFYINSFFIEQVRWLLLRMRWNLFWCFEAMDKRVNNNCRIFKTILFLVLKNDVCFILMVLVSNVAAKMWYTSRYILFIMYYYQLLTATFLKFQSLQIYF